jgi:hypothetical protein
MKDARIAVIVEEIKPPLCDWCFDKGIDRKATRMVKIEAWYGARAAVGRHLACKEHAEEIALQLTKKKP